MGCVPTCFNNLLLKYLLLCNKDDAYPVPVINFSIMKRIFPFFIATLLSFTAFAQPEDPKKMHETAKSFMLAGDYDNAIVVLSRALQSDKNNLEMQKDLVMSYYLKRDFSKALTGVKEMVDREDADVVTYQISGNV